MKPLKKERKGMKMELGLFLQDLIKLFECGVDPKFYEILLCKFPGEIILKEEIVEHRKIVDEINQKIDESIFGTSEEINFPSVISYLEEQLYRISGMNDEESGSFHHSTDSYPEDFQFKFVESPIFTRKSLSMTTKELGKILVKGYVRPLIFVGAFSEHGFILSPKKRLFAFGANAYYQLGLRDVNNRLTPHLHPYINDKIIRIACGYAHTLFLTTKGVLSCGSDLDGRTAQGKIAHISYTSYPKRISTFDRTHIVGVECGTRSSFFISHGGVVYASGSDHLDGMGGIIGTGGGRKILEARRVQIIEKVKRVAAGSRHTLFLTTSGSVYGTGHNTDNRLGMESCVIPVKFSFAKKVKQIEAGGTFSLFLFENNELFFTGEIGDDGDGRPVFSSEIEGGKKPVLFASDIRNIKGGRDHFLFENTDHIIHGFGGNDFNQSGIGDITQARNMDCANKKIREMYCSARCSYFCSKNFELLGCGGDHNSGELFKLDFTAVKPEVILSHNEHKPFEKPISLEEISRLKDKVTVDLIPFSEHTVEAKQKGIEKLIKKKKKKVVVYYGQVNEKGLKDGIGNVYDKEKGFITYFGMFKDGQKHGQGTEFNDDGEIERRGKWINGEYFIDYMQKNAKMDEIKVTDFKFITPWAIGQGKFSTTHHVSYNGNEYCAKLARTNVPYLDVYRE